VSIKNDGHYFCRAGGNRPDGLNEPVTSVCCYHQKYQEYLNDYFLTCRLQGRRKTQTATLSF
ncbi:hypothetical protein, partial [Escherichia coli]|uniref:hypothetical protein n=1 Tax=Escherichia coli TaxID=562 RepID=UPI00112F6FB0